MKEKVKLYDSFKPLTALDRYNATLSMLYLKGLYGSIRKTSLHLEKQKWLLEWIRKQDKYLGI